MPQRNEKKQGTVEAAAEYVRKQIETMKAHGAATKISKTDFRAIVQQVAEAAK
jgi:hypothetical protein